MSSTFEIVAGTGHRPQHLTRAEQDWVDAELPRVVVKLRDEHGMREGVAGMAAGFDLKWARSLVDADVPLWAHVPFPQQPDRWPAAERAEWERLLNLAAKVTWYGDAYDVSLLHARNDGMLDVGRAVLACWKRSKSSGGTASAVSKARARGLPVVHMDPERRIVTLSDLAVQRPETLPLTLPDNSKETRHA